MIRVKSDILDFSVVLIINNIHMIVYKFHFKVTKHDNLSVITL